MASVTNRARATRVLALATGGHAELAPGQTVDIDIDYEHPVHAAWQAAGDIDIIHDEPIEDGEPTEGNEPVKRVRVRPSKAR